MAEVEITNTFVSAKADSADGTLVSSSEWNDKLKIGGGSSGQMFVRDTAQAHGGRWANQPTVYANQGSYSGSSPSPALAANVVVFSANAVILLLTGISVITSGAADVTATIRRDTVTLGTVVVEGSTGKFKVVHFDTNNEVAGTHTYDVVLTASAGTFTSSLVSLTALVVGA